MSRVAFVTDTTCNLPDELTRRYNVHLVPVYVIFEDKSYKDYIEMPPAEFYPRLVAYKAAGKMPTTSQPSPEDFRAMYASLAAQGYTDILSMHLTSKSSGTYQSAAIAAGMLTDVRVHVVDTLTTSMQMGFMLIEAMDAIEAGQSVEQAMALIESHQGQIVPVFYGDGCRSSRSVRAHRRCRESHGSGGVRKTGHWRPRRCT